MKLLWLVCTISMAVAIPVDPSDEVEFVEPVNTNSNDNGEGPFAFGGGFPIIIVRTSGQSPDIEASEGDFPFGSSGFNPFFRRRRPFFGNPNFEGFPVIPREDTDVDVEVDGHSENIGSILKTILGIPEDDREDTRADDTEPQQDDEQTEISSSDERPCGFICTLFQDLNKFADRIEGEIEEMHTEIENQKNEVEPTVDGDLEDGATSNSTYTEEVLPDGTLVKTNRTVVRNPNGVSFVLTQSATFSGGKDKKGDAEPAEPIDEPQKDTAITTEAADRNQVPLLEDAIPIETEDEEAQTEVGAQTTTRTDDGIDDGLLEVVA